MIFHCTNLRHSAEPHQRSIMCVSYTHATRATNKNNTLLIGKPRFVVALSCAGCFGHVLSGVKMWAVCDPQGYCLTSSVDGGMKGDPRLRQWYNCPLGRTARTVLWVLLHACEELGQQIQGSGVYMAMDNFFTSPTLFECLQTHDVFAVGTCRANRTSGATSYWQSRERTLTKRGEMIFGRSGEMVFVQWRDSRDIIWCSTIHIAQPSVAEPGGIDHFAPQPLV